MPQPVAGDPDLVQLWTQTITGQELDAGKSISVLEPAAWRERRARVMASPLRSDLEAGGRRGPRLARQHGRGYEISLVGEAALWHLERLLAVHPEGLVVARAAGRGVAPLSTGCQGPEGTRRGPRIGRASSPCAAGAPSVRRTWSVSHRHEAALWFREWIVAADPKNPQAHDDVGHCQARLGRFAEASDHFARPSRWRPITSATSATWRWRAWRWTTVSGYRKACARLIELAEATEAPRRRT